VFVWFGPKGRFGLVWYKEVGQRGGLGWLAGL